MTINYTTQNKLISTDAIASVDPTAPFTLVDSPKEMLFYGGISVAIIFALGVFILTLNHYNKTLVKSRGKVIKIIIENQNPKS